MYQEFERPFVSTEYPVEQRDVETVSFFVDDKRNWPRKDTVITAEASGELADRIRYAFAEGEVAEEDSYAPVYITEIVQFGGYSEYSQEHMKYIKVEFQGQSETFEEGSGYYESPFSRMMIWLDEAEEKDSVTTED